MSHRARWTVLWVRNAWFVRRGPNTVALWTKKADAVQQAARLAREHRTAGGLAQVVIRGKDGRIQTERTYGADPRRTKG
jgi:hypothetical protein